MMNTQTRGILDKSSARWPSLAIMIIAVALATAPSAFAQQTLSCWYNASGQSTGADSFQGTVGSITHTGTGDYAFSYLISAFDGNACPGTLPATAIRGTTAYLVTQDSLSCTNDDVAANPSNVIGAVTVFLIQSGPAKGKAKVLVRINRAATNTTYHFFQKCARSLGDITTDGSGDGARHISISPT
jgi:hypothetical protein